MQIAQSDFLRDERKNGENPLWIFEYFPKISQKICKQDACEKMPIGSIFILILQNRNKRK